MKYDKILADRFIGHPKGEKRLHLRQCAGKALTEYEGCQSAFWRSHPHIAVTTSAAWI